MNPEPEAPQSKEVSRIESFSDNVYAIALTLLVLTIKVPVIPEGNHPDFLLQQLGRQWPSYLTYAVSFFTVLLMWMNHHVLFNRVRSSNHTLMFLNGLMLLPVTLVPFPTSLLAVFIWHPQARFAAALFAGAYALIAGLYYLLWSYITRMNRATGVEEDEDRVGRLTRKVRSVFIAYLAAICLAFFAPLGCIAMCVVLAVYLALPETRTREDR